MELKYSITTEDGTETMTLTEYHTREDLIKKVGLAASPPGDRKTIFAGLDIYSYPYDLLEKDKRLSAIVDAAENMVAQNPLKYFVPQNESIRNFLNESNVTMKVLVAPNGIGKSVAGWIDTLLDIIPTNPSWPIFTAHGVKHRPYRKQRITSGVGIVTYEWVNHESTIFPQIIQRWTPPEFLGEFKIGGKSTPNWRVNPKMLVGDAPVWFHTCSQSDTVFESSARNQFWWDEQAEESKFRGANERVRRRGGRHVMTLTPHKIKGRADTGAGTWIHNIVKGKATYGHTTKIFTSDIKTIPDWIYSEEGKKQAIRTWIEEPQKNGNIAMLREGESRIFGKFHDTSGLVFDEIVPTIHYIPPFIIPDNWPKFRSVDHGRVEPCAALCATVSPEQDIIFFREYYEKDKLISQNAQGIILASGNRAVESGREVSSGRVLSRYREEGPVKYRWTVMDARSFSKKQDNSEMTIGQMYRYCGLFCKKSSGQPVSAMIEVVKEYLKIDPEREHRHTKKPGAPKVYFFNTLENLIEELSGYSVEESYRMVGGVRKLVEVPKAKNDHLISALMFMLMEKLYYVESRVEEDEENVNVARVYDSITMY